MNKLMAANLYRNELIPISGKIVERYNKCLKKLGFKETALNTFSIDGMGWSPEISAEKKRTTIYAMANPIRMLLLLVRCNIKNRFTCQFMILIGI